MVGYNVDSTLEFPGEELYLTLKPHVILLKAVINMIHVVHLSIHDREHSLAEKGFHLQVDYVFQCLYLF